jgi:hypothetical protein
MNKYAMKYSALLADLRKAWKDADHAALRGIGMNDPNWRTHAAVGTAINQIITRADDREVQK